MRSVQSSSSSRRFRIRAEVHCNRAATGLQQSCNRAATELQQSCGIPPLLCEAPALPHKSSVAVYLRSEELCCSVPPLSAGASSLPPLLCEAATELQQSCTRAATELAATELRRRFLSLRSTSAQRVNRDAAYAHVCRRSVAVCCSRDAAYATYASRHTHTYGSLLGSWGS